MAAAAVGSCCAVAVANGQVSVPGVTVPQTPPLQSVPKVTVPQVTVPQTTTPSVPTLTAPKTPSVKLPSTNDAPKLPSVKTPSVGGSGSGSPSAAGGGQTGSSAGPSYSAGTGTARSSTGARGPATAGAASAHGAGRPALTSRQRAARHEHQLQQAAKQLQGCLPSLPSFERKVISLRAGLHGAPLSRGATARRLHVGPDRVRGAERRGMRGLRHADAEQGCGLKSAAGRRAAAQRLANGSAPPLAPLPVAARTPALVSTDSLRHGHHGELAARASSSPSKASEQPRRAGLIPTSGDEGSSVSPAVWIAALIAIALATLAVVLFRRRNALSHYESGAAGSPYGWAPVLPDDPQRARQPEPPAEPAPAASPPEERPTIPRPAAANESTVVPRPRRRDRAVQALGGVAASGAVASLMIARLMGRRRR